MEGHVYDPKEAARLSAEGICDYRTQIPAGEPIPADHSIWSVPWPITFEMPPSQLPSGRIQHGSSLGVDDEG